jgi:hypothetical protein
MFLTAARGRAASVSGFGRADLKTGHFSQHGTHRTQGKWPCGHPGLREATLFGTLFALQSAR